MSGVCSLICTGRTWAFERGKRDCLRAFALSTPPAIRELTADCFRPCCTDRRRKVTTFLTTFNHRRAQDIPFATQENQPIPAGDWQALCSGCRVCEGVGVTLAVAARLPVGQIVCGWCTRRIRHFRAIWNEEWYDAGSSPARTTDGIESEPGEWTIAVSSRRKIRSSSSSP